MALRGEGTAASFTKRIWSLPAPSPQPSLLQAPSLLDGCTLSAWFYLGERETGRERNRVRAFVWLLFRNPVDVEVLEPISDGPETGLRVWLFRASKSMTPPGPNKQAIAGTTLFKALMLCFGRSGCLWGLGNSPSLAITHSESYGKETDWIALHLLID